MTIIKREYKVLNEIGDDLGEYLDNCSIQFKEEKSMLFISFSTNNYLTKSTLGRIEPLKNPSEIKLKVKVETKKDKMMKSRRATSDEDIEFRFSEVDTVDNVKVEIIE